MVLKRDFFAGASFPAFMEVETRAPLEEGANADAEARQARVTTAVVFIFLFETDSLRYCSGNEVCSLYEDG
jgi:hypothetical protein